VDVVGFAAVTLLVVVADCPLLSVTVKTTGNVPDAANVCDAVDPVAVAPSPKPHAYEMIADAADEGMAALLKSNVSGVTSVARMLTIGEVAGVGVVGVLDAPFAQNATPSGPYPSDV